MCCIDCGTLIYFCITERSKKKFAEQVVASPLDQTYEEDTNDESESAASGHQPVTRSFRDKQPSQL